jgi:hypothetical protein
MISVVIGGGRDEQGTFQSLYTSLGKPNVIDATIEGAFVEFCQRSLRSTNMIELRVGMTDAYTKEIANDDMIVFFPKHYTLMLDIPIVYKLATVIEVAIDLSLDVQAFSFTGHKDWNPRSLTWPGHWPSVSYYSKKDITND